MTRVFQLGGSFLFIVLTQGSLSALANPSLTLPEIGLHTPILRFEKNENPQNLMMVYTKLDPETCGFVLKDSAPVLDEYWLMDGKNFKNVHPMIKSGIADRLELDRDAYQSSKKFLVHLKDFHELKSDLGASPTFEVKPKKSAHVCEASVEIQLGPSDKNRKLSIESVHADSSKTLLPPFRKLQSLTITGKDIATGETVHRTYKTE